MRIAAMQDCTLVELNTIRLNDNPIVGDQLVGIGTKIQCGDKVFLIHSDFPLQARPAAYGAARLLEKGNRHVLIVQTADQYLVGLEICDLNDSLNGHRLDAMT